MEGVVLPIRTHLEVGTDCWVEGGRESSTGRERDKVGLFASEWLFEASTGTIREIHFDTLNYLDQSHSSITDRPRVQLDMPRPTTLVQQAFKHTRCVSSSPVASSSSSLSAAPPPPPSAKQQRQDELYSDMLDKVQHRRAQRHTGRLSLSLPDASGFH